jgi:biotin--protein ligase
MYSDAVVSLASHNEERVSVVGLDKYGYLRVKRKGGDELSLQPDGNSFDIMKGLITMKN